MPVSYLTHFSVSGETLASINSSLLPASAFTNRNLEAIFKPETPTASGGSLRRGGSAGTVGSGPCHRQPRF